MDGGSKQQKQELLRQKLAETASLTVGQYSLSSSNNKQASKEKKENR